nr:hypothetical protein [Micromonospora rubida]
MIGEVSAAAVRHRRVALVLGLLIAGVNGGSVRSRAPWQAGGDVPGSAQPTPHASSSAASVASARACTGLAHESLCMIARWNRPAAACAANCAQTLVAPRRAGRTG